MNVHGFEEENITVLMDDGEHAPPTYENMIQAYKKVVAESESGDAVFLQYVKPNRVKDTVSFCFSLLLIMWTNHLIFITSYSQLLGSWNQNSR